MSDIAIKVENISKRYRIGLKEELHDTFIGALTSWIKYPLSNFRRLQKLSKFCDDGDSEDIIWALKDVSLEVNNGEVLGIIGENGAGKSTLLKILSRITEPTSGRAYVNGRVTSLLEVGIGFHPELTGRENVFLNGAIMGMSKIETVRKFDEIVDFSGIEKFIDTPVKRYSSGMYVRLAFAVAAHLEPEILLVDEVLAVGDVGFQKKCLRKMESVTKEGRTVLFVSHNMASIQSLCSKVALLDNGNLVSLGYPSDIICEYQSPPTLSSHQTDLTKHARREANCIPIITSVKLKDIDGIMKTSFLPGQPMIIEVVLDPQIRLENPIVGLGIDTTLGQRVFSSATYFYKKQLPPITTHRVVRCTIPSLPLMPGKYQLALSCGEYYNSLMDVINGAIWFDVEVADYYGTGYVPSKTQGVVYVDAIWDVDSNPTI